MASLFDSSYYEPSKWAMMACGTWPGSGRFQAWTMRIITFVIESSLAFAEQRYMYKVWGDFDAFIPCLPSQFCIFMAFLKFYFLLVNQKMVEDAVDQITKDWEFLSNKSSDEIMHVHGAIARKKTLLYLYAAVFVLVGYFIGSLAPVMLDIIIPLNQSREKIPTFETDYGVNFEDYYYTILLHGFLGGMIVGLWIWATDALIIIMVQHCCGLFETIGYILKRLNSNDEKKYSEEYEINMILFAIATHKRAIAFAEFIEASVTSAYAVIVMTCMLMISITGVSVILKLDERQEAMRMAALASASVILLFFNTLPSQTLIDGSSHLPTLIYDCDWTSLSIKSQKLILLMLVRSVRPCTLTAGKIYELNMSNFSQVVKTGMSYLTIILSFQ